MLWGASSPILSYTPLECVENIQFLWREST
jgi:hypothetical protein